MDWFSSVWSAQQQWATNNNNNKKMCATTRMNGVMMIGLLLLSVWFLCDTASAETQINNLLNLNEKTLVVNDINYKATGNNAVPTTRRELIDDCADRGTTAKVEGTIFFELDSSLALLTEPTQSEVVELAQHILQHLGVLLRDIYGSELRGFSATIDETQTALDGDSYPLSFKATILFRPCAPTADEVNEVFNSADFPTMLANFVASSGVFQSLTGQAQYNGQTFVDVVPTSPPIPAPQPIPAPAPQPIPAPAPQPIPAPANQPIAAPAPQPIPAPAPQPVPATSPECTNDSIKFTGTWDFIFVFADREPTPTEVTGLEQATWSFFIDLFEDEFGNGVNLSGTTTSSAFDFGPPPTFKMKIEVEVAFQETVATPTTSEVATLLSFGSSQYEEYITEYVFPVEPAGQHIFVLAASTEFSVDGVDLIPGTCAPAPAPQPNPAPVPQPIPAPAPAPSTPELPESCGIQKTFDCNLEEATCDIVLLNVESYDIKVLTFSIVNAQDASHVMTHYEALIAAGGTLATSVSLPPGRPRTTYDVLLEVEIETQLCIDETDFTVDPIPDSTPISCGLHIINLDCDLEEASCRLEVLISGDGFDYDSSLTFDAFDIQGSYAHSDVELSVDKQFSLGSTYSQGYVIGASIILPQGLTGLTIELSFRGTIHLEVPADTGRVTTSEVCTDDATFVFGEDPPISVPGKDSVVMGDPHIKPWLGNWFDYQASCDLLYLMVENIIDGLSMWIYIRTTNRVDFSFIEAAAIQVGENVLEVNGHGRYALDWVDNADLDESTGLGGVFPIYHSKINDKQHVYDIVIGRDEFISISSYKDILSVKVSNGTASHFRNSIGLLGNYTSGELLSRDGIVMTNMNDFGQEWQVRDYEPKLFRTARVPQYPKKCILPTSKTKSSSRRRRLGETIGREKAEAACSHLSGKLFDNCVFDIMATGDIEFAGY